MEQRQVAGVEIHGSSAEWQPKPEDELRVVFPLLERNAGFGDYPDGFSWADLAAAEQLKNAEDSFDQALAEEGGWADAR